MAKIQTIQELLPQAQLTLEHPTHPKPESIEKSKRWLAASGWQLLGVETPSETAALEKSFHQTAEWFASLLEGLEPRWLVFVGISGTGKTMLTKRIVRYIEDYGRALYSRTVGRFLADDNIRRAYSMAQQGPVFIPWRTLLKDKGLRELAGKDWFCAIDELKSETGRRVIINEEEGVQPEPWETRDCGNLFDDMGRRWRIVTMNLTRRQLATFWDVRIASRLTRDDNMLVDLSEVTDFQLRKEQANQKR